LYLNKSAQAIDILKKIIDNRFGITSFLSQCKLDLGDYYLYSGEIWEAALLYGQVDKAYKDEPLGQMAKYRNARLSYYAGEFDWSKAQLDILKASTSQLIANDALNLSLLISDNQNVDTNQQALRLFASADLLVYQHQYKSAIVKLDSIDTLFPVNDLDDDILWLKSTIEMNEQNFGQAIEHYRKIVDQYKDGIWADDALFAIAEAYQFKLKNTELAMKAYQQLIEDFPGSLFMVEARKRYRLLRGS
jgi:TolA-binding protein